MQTNVPGNAKGQNVAIILIVVAVIVLAFWIMKRFFGAFDWLDSGWSGIKDKIGGLFKEGSEYLNLQDTEKEAEQRKIIDDEAVKAASSSSAFSPNFYKTAPAGATLVRRAEADKLAKQIWDSVGTFYDNSSQGLAAFKQMKTKSVVSWVADVFNQNYQRDLYNWLHLKYDTDTQRKTLSEIVTYVNSLKPY